MNSPSPPRCARHLSPVRLSTLAVTALATLLPTPALAHASERGYVLLLPTGYYLIGGAAAVLASFLALFFLPQQHLERLAAWRLPLFAVPTSARLWTSLAAFLIMTALTAAGIFGSRDPLSNPLPLTFWTLIWIGLTLVQGVFGNLWGWLNPWYGPVRLANMLISERHRAHGITPTPNPSPHGGGRSGRAASAPVATSAEGKEKSPSPWGSAGRERRVARPGKVRGGGIEHATEPGISIPSPQKLGYWPALFLFAAFAWFELIDLAPDDPYRLALVIAGYWLFSFIAMLFVGYDTWSRQGEFLSVFLRMVSRFAVFDGRQAVNQQQQVSICLPGAKLWSEPPLPLSGTLFLLLALASVSFDGFSKTFLWLASNGINPLEFPGRSAMQGINSAGLVLTFCGLASVFMLCIAASQTLSARSAFTRAAGQLVWSIVPIALAYHFSHYLTALLVNGQYALVALSDPFGLGWNLFGTAHWQVGAGMVMGFDRAWIIWNCQALAIIGGHVLAVVIAHGLSFRLNGSRSLPAELPLTILMIAYTVFGLWLLSTPTAG